MVAQYLSEKRTNISILGTVKFDIAGHIAIVNFSRPEVLNAINKQMKGDLEKALKLIESRGDVRVVVLKNESRAFCSDRMTTKI